MFNAFHAFHLSTLWRSESFTAPDALETCDMSYNMLAELGDWKVHRYLRELNLRSDLGSRFFVLHSQRLYVKTVNINLWMLTYVDLLWCFDILTFGIFVKAGYIYVEESI